MALLTPAALFGADYSYQAAGTAFTPAVEGIFIPLASLPDMTIAKADPATGNSAEIVRAVLDQSYAVIQALDSASRPTRWSVAKPNPTIITVEGSPAQRQNYTSGHDLNVIDVEPVAE